jgi:hypothetical protein
MLTGHCQDRSNETLRALSLQAARLKLMLATHKPLNACCVLDAAFGCMAPLLTFTLVNWQHKRSMHSAL